MINEVHLPLRCRLFEIHIDTKQSSPIYIRLSFEIKTPIGSFIYFTLFSLSLSLPLEKKKHSARKTERKLRSNSRGKEKKIGKRVTAPATNEECNNRNFQWQTFD